MHVFRFSVRAAALAAAIALAFAARAPLGAATGALPAALDPANRDPNCPACRDFYQFANGGWLAAHPVPGEKPSWSHFSELDDENLNALRTAFEAAAAAHAAPGSRDRKLGDYYAACTDEAGIEARGAAPLQARLRALSGITDRHGLLAAMTRLHAEGNAVFFAYGSQPDPADSSRTIGELGQSGLTLPERDYYTRTDAKSEKLRADLVAHIGRSLVLAGDAQDAADAQAQAVMRVETALANAAVPKAELRDPKATTNPYTVASLSKLGTTIAWPAYLATVGSTRAKINVDTPKYFSKLDRILTTTPVADLRAYVRWHAVRSTLTLLPKAFVDENFAWSQELRGTKVLEPRWKRCIRSAGAVMDQLVGEEFVQQRFSPAAKRHADAMVRNLRAAYRDDIRGLRWMTPATKARAEVKLAAIVQKIGYPERKRDYASLRIARDDYFGNVLRARTFEQHRDLVKIGRPTDRTEWGLAPQDVNALYTPTNNDITFPAAILLPPFYDAGSDDALNYGAIGAVIGHEMTHGFDDQGRQYDSIGNLRDWWTAADGRQFAKRAACITRQYGKLEAAPGVLQNGPLVTGESIADLGGLRIAYAAYERSLAGKARRTIAGYTPEQRFFLAFAAVWAENDTPAFARLLGRSDEHPVGRNRVIGTLRNMPEFARAFHCTARDGMVARPGEVCTIW